jgi:hypothetical protein
MPHRPRESLTITRPTRKGSRSEAPRTTTILNDNARTVIRETWIGLAEVRQRAGASVLLDRNQAFVNVLAPAGDFDSFRLAVERALAEMGFDLIALEDAESLRARQVSFEVAEDLLQLAVEVEVTGATRFGTFHTWRSEGDEAEG